MWIYFMRHGPAEPTAPSGLDADRVLTPSGREAVTDVAAQLVAQRAPGNLRVLASPRKRALETAALVAAALRGVGSEPPVEVEPDLDGSRPIPSGLVEDLFMAGGDALIVGHQPDIEAAVRNLLDGMAAESRKLPHLFVPATLVGLERAEGALRVGLVAAPGLTRR